MDLLIGNNSPEISPDIFILDPHCLAGIFLNGHPLFFQRKAKYLLQLARIPQIFWRPISSLPPGEGPQPWILSQLPGHS